MKRLFTYASLVVTLLVAQTASGHGFRVRIDNEHKIQLASDDPAAGANLVYQSAFLGPPNFRTYDHPGFEVSSLDGPNYFVGGESIYFDVLSPLLYSTGVGAVVPAPPAVNMSITPADLSNPGIVVNGTSVAQPGFLIGNYQVYDPEAGIALGAYDHQLNYTIALNPSVPTGAYALAFRLWGFDSIGNPLTPSNPFVAIWNNNLGGSSLATAQHDLFAAAIQVPEPSSVMLATLAGVGLLVLRRKRK